MPILRHCLAALLSSTCLALVVVPCAAQTSAWSVEYGRDQGAVTDRGVDSTWTTDRLQGRWSRSGQGGWLFAVERQERYGLVDIALGGRGYRHAGDWTFAVDAAATPNAEFLYRLRAGGEASYRVVGTTVVSAAYHYLEFPAVSLDQVEPAVTWYHARGQVEGRVYITRNRDADRTSGAALFRASYEITRRFRLDGGASFGDRIFDVASLPSGPVNGHVIFGDASVGVTRHDFITIGSTIASEDPEFTYRSLMLGYRRVF